MRTLARADPSCPRTGRPAAPDRLFCGAVPALPVARDLVTRGPRRRSTTRARSSTSSAASGLFFEPAVHAWANSAGRADRSTPRAGCTSTRTSRHDGDAGRTNPRGRFYFVRNMFMVGHGDRARRVRAAADRAAALHARVGFHRLGRRVHGRAGRLGSADVLFNPFAASVDARRVRADARARDGPHRPPRWAHAVVGGAPVVTFVVVATANHWWFDGVPGRSSRRWCRAAAHGVFARASARGVGVERKARQAPQPCNQGARASPRIE